MVSTAFLVLETGIVGLVLYIAFFVFLFFAVHKIQKRQLASDLYCGLSKMMAVVSLIIVVYNVSMRTEAAYMMYFVLSLPFIQARAKQHKLATNEQDI